MQTAQAPHLAERGRKGVRTRELLFQAALQEFRRVGVDAASIGRITTRAGTSRASFYFHYPCKEAVLLDLQWRLENDMVERIRRRATLREALEEVIAALIDIDAKLARGDLLRDMLSVYIRRPAGLDLADRQFPLPLEIGRRFAQARQSELRAGLDPELATHLFLTSLFGALVSPRGPLREQRGELQQLASLFLDDRRRLRPRA